MHPPGPVSNERVVVDGRFFRLGGAKFHPKGVTYGPFAPGPDGHGFPPRGQVHLDFELIRELGANLVRAYEVPPRWLLDLAVSHGLRVLVDIPWGSHLCFLDRADGARRAFDAVRKAASVCHGHPAVFAYSVANEIPPEIVRWQGAARTRAFINRLIDAVREVDPGSLCTFASFPPTEYLEADGADFLCFNLFLHEPAAFESYLARLQLLADGRPLLLGETGVDSLREGEVRKCQMLDWQIETVFRSGLAGVVLFSFSDDWHRGGQAVTDWAFGLTSRTRTPKASYRVVQERYRTLPPVPLPRAPKVSVIVACHNGQRTLKACLESLTQLNYPDYEVVLVDDGSDDPTPGIAQSVPGVRYVRQDHHGLSVARNTGIAAATGEIVAYTDADCRADADWLYYAVSELLRDGWAGVGGPNLLPPDDSRTAAAVMASPGGPAHVMLIDREAEHIPGCNMVFWKWALLEIGGFDPVFRTAGDDVDLCWRLREAGGRIGYSPAAFVWHYRRSTVRAYLRQQSGYGEAEALLARKHPEHFNSVGASAWHGRIYSSSSPGAHLGRSVIYRGVFGTGLFQRLYAPVPDALLASATSLEYHTLVTLPLLVLGIAFPALLPLALGSLAFSLGAALVAGMQARIPHTKQALWSRALVITLHLLQPLVRGWARHRWRFTARSLRPTTFRRTAVEPGGLFSPSEITLTFWAGDGCTRVRLIEAFSAQLREEAWEWRPDTGWGDFDLEIYGRRWARLQLTTVCEESGGGRRTLKCRLRSRWSVVARGALAALLSVDLLLVALWGDLQPWLWLSLLILPLLGWRIEQERRLLVRLLLAPLREVAARLGLRELPSRPIGPATSASSSTPESC